MAVQKHSKHDVCGVLLTKSEQDSMTGDRDHDAKIFGNALVNSMAKYGVTYEAMKIFAMWMVWHSNEKYYLNMRLPTKSGKDYQLMTFDATTPDLKQNILNITTPKGNKFLSLCYDLNVTWGKAVPEHGEFFYNIRMFACGTVGGVYSTDKDTFYLISIDNVVKHNGDFSDTISALESQLADKGFSYLAVLDFQNDRLEKHFLERGYEPVNKYGIDGVQKRLM